MNYVNNMCNKGGYHTCNKRGWGPVVFQFGWGNKVQGGYCFVCVGLWCAAASKRNLGFN
ncbi:hypothetical protein Hanom_Chr11g01025791 [Helianthus anomalus]